MNPLERALTIRLPSAMYTRLEQDAGRNERSVAGQIRYIVGLYYRETDAAQEARAKTEHDRA